MSKKTDTKEKIILAAFSFYKNPSMEKASLSKIAARVGITKAAIYKHFSGREDLERAMSDYIYDTTQAELAALRKKDPDLLSRESMAAIAEFFVSHIEFLSFFIMSSPCISVDTLLLEFKRHGVEGLDDVIGADCFIKSMPKYITCIFVCTTFVPFILGRKGGRVNSCSQDDRSFSSGLADLVYRGAGFIPSDEKRLVELDELCIKDIGGLAPLDRILKALSGVIAKNGFTGVTVEAIAQELGMAKSSLYTWFSNKSEMIITLIRNEMGSMISFVNRNLSFVNEPQEKIYVLLKTCLEYLIARPETLDVFKWIQLQNIKIFPEGHICEGVENLVGLSRLIEKNRKIVCSDMSPFYIPWLFSMSVFVVVQGRIHRFSKETMCGILRILFFLVCGGVEFRISNFNTDIIGEIK